MINLQEETVMPFKTAGEWIAALVGGRPVQPGTLTRWATIGVRGNKLDAIKLGGRWLTSKEALQRFADRTGSHGSPPRASADPSVDVRLEQLGLMDGRDKRRAPK